MNERIFIFMWSHNQLEAKLSGSVCRSCISFHTVDQVQPMEGSKWHIKKNYLLVPLGPLDSRAQNHFQKVYQNLSKRLLNNQNYIIAQDQKENFLLSFSLFFSAGLKNIWRLFKKTHLRFFFFCKKKSFPDTNQIGLNSFDYKNGPEIGML